MKIQSKGFKDEAKMVLGNSLKLHFKPIILHNDDNY
jgi:hypothetical protein